MTLALHGYQDWQRALQTADLVAATVNQTVAFASSFSTAIFDVRAYSSFSLSAFARTVAAGFAFQRIDFTILFGDDASMTNVIYEDNYEIFAEGNGSVGFPSLNGKIQLQDAIHGPFMQIVVGNFGSQSITTTIRIFGNSRALGKRYLGNMNSVGNFNVDVLSSLLLAIGPVNTAAGTITNYLMRMAPGPVFHRWFAATSAHAFRYFIPDGRQIYSNGLGAGVEQREILNFPRAAVRLEVENTGGVAGDHYAYVTSSRDDW